MLTALDHIVLVCTDIDAAVADYETAFGRAPAWRAEADGAATALFSAAGGALELMAPSGVGPVGDRLREILATDGEGLKSIAFRTADIASARHTLTRRGLDPSDISEGRSEDLAGRGVRHWKRFRCDDTATGGIKTFILQQSDGALPAAPETPAPETASAVTGLDHLVVATPNPDRATALYGARLGLRFALDRIAEQWKTRFLFFWAGEAKFEVIHRLGEAADPSANDTLWGVTWKTDDLDAAHARLTAAGRDVSEIRTGRKPGSQVFTLRDGTCGVPTLFISHAPR